MTRRLAEVAKKVGVSEATVSRVLNGKPRRLRATRDAVLTALDVLGYERPTKLRGERGPAGRPGAARAAEPDLPGASPRWSAGALAQQGFTPVLCTRTAGGVSEADYIEMLLDQQVSGVIFAGGYYAQADAAARALPPAARAPAAGRAGQRRRSTSWASRGSRADDAVAVEQALRAPALARPRARSAWCSGPADHMPVAAQAGRVPAAAAAAGSSCDDAGRARACSRWRAARPRPPG